MSEPRHMKKPEVADPERRRILRLLGKGSVVAAFIAQIGAAGAHSTPTSFTSRRRRFKLKRPDEYPPRIHFRFGASSFRGAREG